MGRAARAQTVNFNYFAAPTFVANTGESEVLGAVILTADATCGGSADTFCISSAGSIQVTYTGVTIDNSTTTGITVCESLAGVVTCNAAGGYLSGTIAVGSSPQGGVVSIGVKAGTNFANGDQLRIGGVRGRIAESPLITPGTATNAILTVAPNIAAGFSPTSAVVARSAESLTVALVGDPLVPCLGSDPAAVIELREEFNTAFVDHGDPGETTYPGLPANPRPSFGATNSTRFNLVLSGLVPGIEVHWPATVLSLTSSAVLNLVSQTANGSSAVYAFGTPDQAASDVVLENFDIQLGAAQFTFSGNNLISGDVTVQGQMAPPATPTTARPRFNDPLKPTPAPFLLALRRCNTTSGTLTLRAQVDGLSWSGHLGWTLTGGDTLTGDTVTAVLDGVPAGAYSLQYNFGGPAGAIFSNYIPSRNIIVTANGTTQATFDFVGPTIANLQLLASSTQVCNSADRTVGTFQLVNTTSDQQIIRGGTRFTFTFNSPVVAAPTLGGLGSITPTVNGTNVTFEIAGSLSLRPGEALTFTGTRLNLSSLQNAQNVTVQFSATPSVAINLPSNQVTIATTDAASCVAPLPTATLTVNPSTITAGQSATLSWTSTNATSLDIQPGIGSVAASGSMTVSPSRTTTYILSAQGPNGLGVSVFAVLTVNPPPGQPSFIALGVTNGASFLPGISPGSISTIFGTRLSNVTGILEAGRIPLPTQLDGVIVTVNGTAAPIFALAKVNGVEQINFQVPWELAGQTSASIVVNNNGSASSSVTVNVLSAFPGIFITDGNTGAILHGSGSALVTSSNPAAAGEVVVLFATGLGSVSNTPATGTLALANPLSRMPTLPVVTVAGLPATVEFAGLAPNFVGLYQINVKLPANVPSGSQDVVVQFNGQASSAAKIAIR